jgi:hypothetical protein
MDGFDASPLAYIFAELQKILQKNAITKAQARIQNVLEDCFILRCHKEAVSVYFDSFD